MSSASGERGWLEDSPLFFSRKEDYTDVAIDEAQPLHPPFDGAFTPTSREYAAALALSKDDTLLWLPCKEARDLPFDGERFTRTAVAALTADPRLNETRLRLSRHKNMSERRFWQHYSAWLQMIVQLGGPVPPSVGAIPAQWSSALSASVCADALLQQSAGSASSLQGSDDGSLDTRTSMSSAGATAGSEAFGAERAVIPLGPDPAQRRIREKLQAINQQLTDEESEATDEEGGSNVGNSSRHTSDVGDYPASRGGRVTFSAGNSAVSDDVDGSIVSRDHRLDEQMSSLTLGEASALAEELNQLRRQVAQQSIAGADQSSGDAAVAAEAALERALRVEVRMRESMEAEVKGLRESLEESQRMNGHFEQLIAVLKEQVRKLDGMESRRDVDIEYLKAVLMSAYETGSFASILPTLSQLLHLSREEQGSAQAGMETWNGGIIDRITGLVPHLKAATVLPPVARPDRQFVYNHGGTVAPPAGAGAEDAPAADTMRSATRAAMREATAAEAPPAAAAAAAPPADGVTVSALDRLSAVTAEKKGWFS